MTINLKETSTVLGAWFISTHDDMDWMGVMYKDDDNSNWMLKARMRYYGDDDSFGDKDKKDWAAFEYEGEESDEELFAGISNTVRILAERMNGEVDTLRGPYTSAQYITELRKKPWAHTKVADSANEAGDADSSVFVRKKINPAPIKPFNCPNCDVLLVANTNDHGESYGRDMKSGDVGFCAYCQEIFILTGMCIGRKATDEEKAKHNATPEIKRIREMLKDRKRKDEDVTSPRTIN